MKLRAGRKRKPNAVRDAKGKSRDSELRERQTYAMTIARRGAELESLGIDPEQAVNRLAGFTLGKLYLAGKRSPDDAGVISQDQYDAGNWWARVIYDYHKVIGAKLNISSPGFFLVGGTSTAAEPTESQIANTKAMFVRCMDALKEVAREHRRPGENGSVRLIVVAYGVCVDNWPMEDLSRDDVGLLRLALNRLGMVRQKGIVG